VRRIVPLVFTLLAACSSGGRATEASTASARSSSSSSTASDIATTTLEPAAQSSLDQQGALAFGSVIGESIRRAYPDTVTPQHVECLANALVANLGAHHLLELADESFDSYPAVDRDAAVAAFRQCGFGDDIIQRIGLLPAA
jgi:hypothetical protein